MNNSPLVSLIFINWNGEHLISQYLNSLLGLTIQIWK